MTLGKTMLCLESQCLYIGILGLLELLIVFHPSLQVAEM